MDTRLPKLVDPSRLAAKRETLSGELPASNISRLTALYDISEPVEVSLSFAPDGLGQSAVTGELNAVLKSQCQRCLGPLSVAVRHVIDLRVLDLDQFMGGREDALETAVDDTVEYRSKLNIYELVEDELVLSTPIIPRHEGNECLAPNDRAQTDLNDSKKQGGLSENDDKMPPPSASDGRLDNDDVRETTRPFAGLAEMLSSDD